MIAPLVEAIANERPDILVGKVDVDQEMELAIRFGIASIPTLLVFKGGELTASSVGYCSKDAITALLDK
jgi:thioredoxin 1